MPSRELVVLGSASQSPTRYRNHNGYLLLWDEYGILFDPGEGTQRQMIFAGVAPSRITHICITHFHGDHCLGLPGVLQRLALDRVDHRIDVLYPASGEAYFERLRHASAYNDTVEVVAHPVEADGVVLGGEAFDLSARRLDHDPETFGWRLDEPARRRMLVGELERRGIAGPAIGVLQREGEVLIGDEHVGIEEVSEERPGQSVAFVMDTRLCDAAFDLADEVDLLICEATFASADAELATAYRHLTASQAGEIAHRSRARQLLITHFSQRYPDETALLEEAGAVFANTAAAKDLMRLELPPRRSPKSRSEPQ